MAELTEEGVPSLRSHSQLSLRNLLWLFLSPEKCWPTHKLIRGRFFYSVGGSCIEVMHNISKCDIFIFSSCGAHTTHNTGTSQM